MRTKASASIRSDEGEWVPLQEAATRLGVSTRTIQRHIRAGKLDVRRFENRRIYVKVRLDEGKAPSQSNLNDAHLKLDRLIELVETAIRLYSPRSLDELADKWAKNK